MRLALYQPDIAQNTGTLLRLGACLGVGVDIIEPCGFPFDDRRFRRAGMDYLDQVDWRRHAHWEAFLAQKTGRLLLLSTKAAVVYTRYQFLPDDILLLGQESAGVPDAVRGKVDQAITIPMRPPARSLNVAMAAAMVVGEALRQTGFFEVGNKL